MPAPAGNPAPTDLPQAPLPAAAQATVRTPPPRAAATAPDATVQAASGEPNPVIAAGAGIVFGLLVSTLLWFRGRLPARKRPVAAARQEDEPASPVPAAFATLPASLDTRPAEPGFSVSFTPAGEDALAAEFADDSASGYETPPAKAAHSAGTSVQAPSEDITSELEELFDSTDTTIQKRLNAEKTLAARAFGQDPAGYAPDADTSDADVDFLVGDPTGEEALLQAATVEQPRPGLEATVQSPTVDLRSLATSATRDQQQAQTLLEALTLLERDYEEELTASQVLDMSAMRDALANDLDEPTQISDTRLREAAARKKSR